LNRLLATLAEEWQASMMSEMSPAFIIWKYSARLAVANKLLTSGVSAQSGQRPSVGIR
jgi:hypothetical protein